MGARHVSLRSIPAFSPPCANIGSSIWVFVGMPPITFTAKKLIEGSTNQIVGDMVTILKLFRDMSF